MHKNQSSAINISITTAVRVTKRNRNRDQSLARASHISLYLSQMEKLEEVARSEGKAVAQVIREAVKRFFNKATYERDTFNFSPSLTKGAKRIYPLFSKSEWDMLGLAMQLGLELKPKEEEKE